MVNANFVSNWVDSLGDSDDTQDGQDRGAEQKVAPTAVDATTQQTANVVRTAAWDPHNLGWGVT